MRLLSAALAAFFLLATAPAVQPFDAAQRARLLDGAGLRRHFTSIANSARRTSPANGIRTQFTS